MSAAGLDCFEQGVAQAERAWFAGLCNKPARAKGFFRAKPATLGLASVAVRKQPRQDPLVVETNLYLCAM